MSLFGLNGGSSSIQGARENQEDYSGQVVSSTYAIGFLPPTHSLYSRSDHLWTSYICDGHNGRQCADSLGATFGEQMAEAATGLAANASHDEICQAMVKSYCNEPPPCLLFSDCSRAYERVVHLVGR